MRKLPYYQVDAFTGHLFRGNPAGVCLLDRWPEDAMLRDVAAENNHSETAFILGADDGFELRWFTPVTEVALCGHATLAAALVVFNRLGWAGDAVPFLTRRSGTLTVSRRGDLLAMDFPARPPFPHDPPPGLATALGVEPREVMLSAEDWLVRLAGEDEVAGLAPDIPALAVLGHRGFIVTAPGRECDFVSRFFAPAVGVPEDPVTGSAHAVLTPYWSARLGKPSMRALQVSRRGGEIFCEDAGARTVIAGRAVFYLEGLIALPDGA